jgi:hypothetical protein
VTQLALAWVAKVHPYTSTVILGATKPEQLIENLGAIVVLPKLTPEVMEQIEKVLDNKPNPIVSHALPAPALARPLHARSLTAEWPQAVAARKPYDRNFHALA